MSQPTWVVYVALLAAPLLSAQDYRVPAREERPARRIGARSILPGGRFVEPLGRQFATGAGAFGLAVSPNGRYAVTTDIGPVKNSLTVLDLRGRFGRVRIMEAGPPEASVRGPLGPGAGWEGVSTGVAFRDNDSVFFSEGNSGRVQLVELESGRTELTLNLNSGGYRDSYTGHMAYDSVRKRLVVVDQANHRLAIIDVPRRRISSVPVGRLPFAVALSSDGARAYVTNLGLFDYRALGTSGSVPPWLPFPAFAYAPGAPARQVVEWQGELPWPGGPADESGGSVAVVELHGPSGPRLLKFIPTGRSPGKNAVGGSSPSGVCASGNRVFVSNAHNDLVTVIDARTLEIETEIPLRVPGLEGLRGVLPAGLAADPKRNWLLVAEAGLNAVAVVRLDTLQVAGHLPAGWYPVSVAVRQDSVFVAALKGLGAGPSATRFKPLDPRSAVALHAGLVSVFPAPSMAELATHTAKVWQAAGLTPRKTPLSDLPSPLRYAVLIIKESRSFDEVLGDIERASNGTVEAAPDLARLGARGLILRQPGGFASRIQGRMFNLSVNHHELAARFAFSDNFFADSESSVGGHHWLSGAPPNPWVESSWRAAYSSGKDPRPGSPAPGRYAFPGFSPSPGPESLPEAGLLWDHLRRHRIPFRVFGFGVETVGSFPGEGYEPWARQFFTNTPLSAALYENLSHDYPGFHLNVPDQVRATRFIREIEERYRRTGEALPRLLVLHLPNDHLGPARPAAGYPVPYSYMADNDAALGRIVEYLSLSPWWKEMAVFITEDDAQDGADHIDAHRTILLIASPFARRNYVSRRNTSFPSLLKAVLRIVGAPPLNLFDATATGLEDCFTGAPDDSPYQAKPADPALFDPHLALGPSPAPAEPQRDQVSPWRRLPPRR